MKYTAVILLLFLNLSLLAQNTQSILDFEYQGFKLNGVYDSPKESEPKGIVLIVHGSGSTNAVAQDWHGDVRRSILKAGYATYMWDKMGCGNSEGEFDYNQSVNSSADEVLAAIKMLQDNKVNGSETIGLWGISRAGWINPIVINKYADIKFWISVSGVDEKENFAYLLEKNLQIEGLSPESVNLIVEEWREGNRISHRGGSYEEYTAATQNLSENKFMQRFMNGKITKSSYESFQKGFVKESFEESTGLQIYIDDFEQILSSIDCPVLAIFGERDMNVDWTKTRDLYQRTLGENTSLTIKTFPDANHNLFQSKTGGFYEFQDNNLPYIRSEGYLEAMEGWLKWLE